MTRAQLVLFASALVTLAACSKGKPTGTAVASGDGISITAEELKAKLEEQSPFIRSRYTTIERKQEFLENLIRFELLAHEATRRKLDQDPEVQATLKKILVQRLVRQEFDEATAKADDAEVKKFYDDHLEEFVKPERVRVQLLWIEAPQGAPDRALKLADAKKLLGRIKAAETQNPLAFSGMARDASQDLASKTSGGDLGFRTADELTRQYSKELATAAFALKDNGQTSDVVDSPKGLAILKLTGRQPAVNRPFDEMKAQLTARVGREKRTKDFDEYVKKLRADAGVTINRAELEKVTVSMSGGGTGVATAAPSAEGLPAPSTANPPAAGQPTTTKP